MHLTHWSYRSFNSAARTYSTIAITSSSLSTEWNSGLANLWAALIPANKRKRLRKSINDSLYMATDYVLLSPVCVDYVDCDKNARTSDTLIVSRGSRYSRMMTKTRLTNRQRLSDTIIDPKPSRAAFKLTDFVFARMKVYRLEFVLYTRT